MGIETGRFVQSTLDKDLVICPVCLDVLESPVELPDCEHVFCGACIKNWFDTGVKVCPLDRIPVTRKLMMPNRTLQVVLDRLKIRCKFVSRGCEKVVGVGQRNEHERSCAFNPRPDTRTRSRDDAIHDLAEHRRRGGNAYASSGRQPTGNGRQGGNDQVEEETSTGFWVLMVLGVAVGVLFGLLRR
ncbi:putative E3 ubiquitin-protein ligase NRDP1 [Hypsibius exemplaris]|uniref:E3 ubiquitin-protein ligase NRDP1 n=1 Tax=Hypsibius exemplaris TaxID=2072580 RepID=A0A1W0XDJ7_HYPEX|nr:putative E3 ubiquitin-protein ligase NRDP1 [Hypsibius exemplaris]